MIYDPENREVYFSTEMIQSEADAGVSYEHFKAYCVRSVNVPLNKFRCTSSLRTQQTCSKDKYQFPESLSQYELAIFLFSSSS